MLHIQRATSLITHKFYKVTDKLAKYEAQQTGTRIMTQQSIPKHTFWRIGQLPTNSFAHWQVSLTSFPAKWPVGRVRSLTWHHARDVATCGLPLISLGVPADNETCWAIDKSSNFTRIHVWLWCPTAVKSKFAEFEYSQRSLRIWFAFGRSKNFSEKTGRNTASWKATHIWENIIKNELNGLKFSWRWLRRVLFSTI